MLETIREYARERLEEARETDDLERRHAEFLLGFAETALESPDRTAAALVLEPERENLRAVIEWALRASQQEMSLLLATSYGVLCAYHGPYDEGRRWLETALQKGGEHPTARAGALRTVSSLAVRQGDLDRARTSAEEWLALVRRVGEATDVAEALRTLGMIACDMGDYEVSEALQREALALFRRSCNDRQVRESLAMLAWVGIARRDYPKARSGYEETLTLSREAGDSRGILLAVGNLAHVALRQGQILEALDFMREAVPLAYDNFNLEYLAEVLTQVAAVAARQDQYERAAVILGGAEALFEGAGGVREPVWHELHEETVTILRHELQADGLAACRERGRSMTVEQLVADAQRFIVSAK